MIVYICYSIQELVFEELFKKQQKLKANERKEKTKKRNEVHVYMWYIVYVRANHCVSTLIDLHQGCSQRKVIERC